MTTELIPQAQNDLQPYQEQAEQFDLGLAPGEAKPARLGWNGREGQFIDSLSGEVMDSLTVIILTKLPDTRIRFNPNPKAPKEERILCRSFDMRTPHDPEQATLIGAGPTCAECQFHDFSKDEYGNTTRPGCAPILTLGIATDEPEPTALLFSTKSISGATMRRILATIENLRTAKKRPPFAYKVALSAGEKVTDPNKAYYPLVARVISERVEPALWPDYANLFRMIRAYDPLAYAADADDVAPEETTPAAPIDHGAPVHVMTPDELLERLDAGELSQSTDAAGEPVIVAPEQPRKAQISDLYGETPDTTRKRSTEPMPVWSGIPPAAGAEQTALGMDVRTTRVDPADVRRAGRR